MSVRVPIGTHILQVAPMIDVTDRDFRFFIRLLSKRVQLWTEMVAANAVIHTSDLDKLLGYSREEHPIVCQLGGNDPEALKKATSVVAHFVYDEINLNVGARAAGWRSVVGLGRR